MKTNLFRVKEKKEKRIIIEEEKLKNPFLLFLKRHKNFILLSGIMIAICLLLISTGIAFSLFRGSNDYDISYIEGDETIGSNNDPSIDDEDVKEDLLGEIARAEGIVLQTKTFMTLDGDVVSYFTDGTSIVVRTDGKIYRISTNDKGTYGINENGQIDDTAKKILVESTTTTLMDGTIITYDSARTAKVEHKTQTLFIRDSNNIKIDNGSKLATLNPSGVAPTRETTKVETSTVKTFTDGTTLLIINGQYFIVNKNTEVTTTETDINYSKNNIFASISDKTYEDGNDIIHFSNGSAIIIEPNGNVTYVKKSGDLIITKEQKLYEIYPAEDGVSRTTFKIADNKKVTYFDNGAAIIINPDGTREYVEDSDDIIYDDNKNIISNPNTSKLISEKETTNGEKVYNFDNGKSQVMKPDGESYITDTSKLEFNTEGEIIDKTEEEDKKDEEGKDNSNVGNPGEGIIITEAEFDPDVNNNMQTTKFIIKNNSNQTKILRITIEEIEDYLKYNTDRLPPQYVKFQATVGDNYVPATTLTENTWIDEDNRTNYILYDGIIRPQETLEVAVLLYVDYAPLDNSWQNTGFLGTIRVYVEDGRR